MASQSINIKTVLNNNIVGINCGSAGSGSAKLGGSINISLFPYLTSFTCANNGIVSLTGIDACPSLIFFNCSNNSLTGPVPALTGNLQIVDFWGFSNNFTGTLQTLVNNVNLQRYYINSNPSLTGPLPPLPSSLQGLIAYGCNFQGPLPGITINNPNIIEINLATNQLNSNVPNVSNNTGLRLFDCTSNYLSGAFPDIISNNPNLFYFRVGNQLGTQKITGNVPALITNPKLQQFQCFANALTGFTQAPVPPSLTSFNAANNLFSLTAINNCLSSFATMATTYNINNGGLYLHGVNMPAITGVALTGPINISNTAFYNTLIARSWTVSTGSLVVVG